MDNPYLKLKSEIEGEADSSSNPYLKLKGSTSNVVGTNLEPITQPTQYRKILTATEDARTSADESARQNKLRTIAWETAKGTPSAALRIGKQVAEDPKEAARQFALGVANGMTFGGTDYLQRRAFISQAKINGMDEEVARSLADSYLKPQDSELSAIRGGGNVSGMLAPYAYAEQVALKGMAYAAPQFVAKHQAAARLLADIGVWLPVFFRR